jgi:quercetin dioxygenase-like cupin family protein
MDFIERVCWDGKPLCYIIRKSFLPDKTTFLTPEEFNLQVGYIVHEAGHEIPRHTHVPVKREIVGTAEVLLVRRGRCEIEVFNDERLRVDTRELSEGDIMIMVGGGHGFRMLEDTVLLEVKQGPYPGTKEKEQF